MDKLKKSRVPVRAQITRGVNDCEGLLACNPIDKVLLTAKLQVMQEYHERLEGLDQELADAMLNGGATEEEIEEEFNNQANYKEKYFVIKAKVEAVLTPQIVIPSPPASEYGTGRSNEGRMNPSYKLPEIQLMKFSGQLIDWLPFWSQFETIHNDAHLDKRIKFQILAQSMEKDTEAHQLVKGHILHQDNYDAVVDALKKRFGSDKVLHQMYIRELLKLQINNESKEKFAIFWMKTESHLRSLKSLNLDKVDPDNWLIPIVESNIPEDILLNWQLSPESKRDGSKENPPRTQLDILVEFVGSQIEAKRNVELAHQGLKTTEDSKVKEKSNAQIKKRKRGDVPTAVDLVAVDKKNECCFCSKAHLSQDCLTAMKWTVEERRKKVRDENRCFSCLKPTSKNHKANNCKSIVKCIVCGGHHYPIVCAEVKNTTKPKEGTNNETDELSAKMQSVVLDEVPQSSCANYASSCEVLIPNLAVKVIGANGKIQTVRMGIDTYSQHSYIKNELAKEMGYQPKSKAIFNHAVFGGNVIPEFHPMYMIELKSAIGTFGCKLSAYGQKEITSAAPAVASRQVIQEMKENGVLLGDVSDFPRKIDILIGADHAGKLMTGNKIQLKSGPVAFETRFGWFLIGKPNEVSERSAAEEFIVTSLVNVQLPSALWDLEAIGIMDPSQIKSKEELDKEALDHFRRTVSRKEDGRYQVRLPWIEGHPPLPTNKSVAEKRLENATKKLEKQKKFSDYHSVFKEWVDMNIVEVVPAHEIERKCHYLPHRPVFKPESSTTKVRPVFDASCKVKCASLNDCLVKGPNLLELIPDLLLRFREKKTACTADIKKAFLMIEIAQEDKDYLRFLWYTSSQSSPFDVDNGSKVLTALRHCRVVFGVNCSPFLLGAVLEHHVNSSNSIDEDIAQKFLKSLYVDNVVASFNTTEEYFKFKEKSVQVMNEARFDLRMWESNIDDKIDVHCTNVLGIRWKRSTDVLFCAFEKNLNCENKVTKRIMLSSTARVFDPLGILSPVTLVPKKLLQKCWLTKTDWDDEVDEEISAEFRAWVNELELINEVEVPRFIGEPGQDDSVHIFCDASTSGYAAVAYFRKESEGNAEIKFIMSRSRVAPLHKTTVNRLELIGCEIGARLGHTIKQALNWGNVKFCYWTDSTTARAWIHRDKDWGTFVGNRVRKILAITNNTEWKHVPGPLNPADLPSRGCGVKSLMESAWLQGPEWLKLNPEEWPSATNEENEDEILAEAKKTTTVAVCAEPWYVKFSTFNRIVRTMAWMRRFLTILRTEKNNFPSELEVNELKEAERRLFYLMQQDAQMQDTKIGIDVVRDKEGLLRVKTKLTNRLDEEDFKQPILLPGKHYLTTLLIRREHFRHCHAGPQFLMASLRETVWITGARRAIESVIKNCKMCRRFTATHPEPSTAPLPEDRVKDAAPFEVVGVDLAGPLYLKNGKKVWICLFTCAVFRAVHLELVTSLSTENFLLSFRRFVSRRGRPTIIYSDNGTNFTGAKRMMSEVDWENIKKDASVDQIQWKLIPPSSPWWGGFWERMVRTVKNLLVRMLGKKTLEMEELSTILCEVEAVVNGRPLTYVYENDEVQPLTSAMFIVGVRQSGVPEVDDLDRTGFQKRFKLRQRLIEDLKGRFRREYLGLLVQRKKETKDMKLKPGDVVLIGCDNMKRILWPTGIIQEIIKGKDGEERTAKIKTVNGIMVRPYQRLYPMEVDKEGENKFKESVQSRSGRTIRKPDRYLK